MQPVSALIAILSQYQPATVWLGFSGGLDSTVLLHATAQAVKHFPDIQIQAIHVNHGLSPLAEQWAAHCQSQAQQLTIACHVERLASKPAVGESIEHWARQQRYACFEKYVKKGDLLLTAHHQDDQAETVLLQLLRGAGPKGLSAMAQISDFKEAVLARPFLGISRQELEAYAKEHKLSFVDDHSNLDIRYDRNFIRHQIMPVLKQRWPVCAELFARSAQNCAEQEQVLQEYIACELQDLGLTIPAQAGVQTAFPIDQLLQHSQPKQNLLLRAWIHQISNQAPSRQLLDNIRHNIVEAAQDAEPFIKWGNWEFRRYHHALYLIQALPEVPQGYSVKWNGNKPLQVPTWPVALTKQYLLEQGLDNINQLDWEKLVVKLREGKERCRPKGRQHSQSLKKCLQEAGIPPWLRDRMPLIYYNDQLIMVVGGFPCQP
ncbi:MAG: tRNA lysidine(34) synthetase TilS [Gammaproteobacteria bacterium]|jgi:tRNA(Ile)-lysidine synthase|nr:tRNA lysidine(34) synthetase TilS [Gammaproteobacteria bacterium]